VAVLLVAPPVQIRLVDGKNIQTEAKVYSGDSHRIEMLPGEHRVRCYFWRSVQSGNVQRTDSSGDTTITFTARAGCVYRLLHQHITPTRMEFKIVDEKPKADPKGGEQKP
jgi:hypothetical protein